MSQERRSGWAAGDHIRLRGAVWRIADVVAHDDCEALRVEEMAPPGGGGRSPERVFLCPFDRPTRLPRGGRAGPARRKTARAWGRALVSLAAGAAPWDGLRTALSGRFELLPYQLEPAIALLRNTAHRLLIADEVGLGKTIQAGLAVSELRARGEADHVLVVTPAGLRDQWQEELRERFSLDAEVADASSIARLARELPRGVNPWALARIAIVSIDFIKRPDVLHGLDEVLWDLVIFDEAHALGAASDRGLAARALAARARRVLLLTATPHDGNDDAFESLCGVGLSGGADVPGPPGRDAIMIFRRLRVDVGLPSKRRVSLLRVQPTAAERHMHALLERYIASARARRREGPSDAAVLLAMAVLKKRALSSAGSLAASVSRRLEWLDRLVEDPTVQLALPFGPPSDPESTPADEAPDRLLAAPAEDGHGGARRERAWLGAILQAATLASAGESKYAALLRLVRRTREPILIFTEYRDTLQRLARWLAARAPGTPLALLHGGLPRVERLDAARRFTTGDVRLLLATDAAGEGLNLQARCRLVVNLELPWNPFRLEQRIGRIDRLGQVRMVHAMHLVARHTSETDVLGRLLRRVERAQRVLGYSRHIVKAPAEDAIAAAMLGVREGELPLDTAPSTDAQATYRDRSPRRLDLEDAAGRERARVATLRAIAVRHATPFDALRFERTKPWRARLGPQRTLTRGHLFIFSAPLVDGRGCLVERFVVPVHVAGEIDEGATARAWELAADAACRRRAALERAVAPGLARLRAREAAAAAALLEPLARHPLQPGLFDRRREREWLLRRAAAADLAAAQQRRLKALDQAQWVRVDGEVELVLIAACR